MSARQQQYHYHQSPTSTSTPKQFPAGGASSAAAGAVRFASQENQNQADHTVHSPSSSSSAQQQQQQVSFLNKRLQFVLSTGSVFRQKVVLLLRQCAANASNNSNSSGNPMSADGAMQLRESIAIRKLYDDVMSEVQQAEDDLRIALTSQHDPQQPLQQDGMGLNDGAPTTATAKNRPQQQVQRERLPDDAESIRKAHHICQILAEKNAIKEQEVRLRQDHNNLQAKYDDLNDRHKRLILAQSNGSGGLHGYHPDHTNPTALAFRELYEGRIKELEGVIATLRQENANLRANSTPIASHARSGHALPSSQHRHGRGGKSLESPDGMVADREESQGRSGSMELVTITKNNNSDEAENVQLLTKHNNLLRSRVVKLKEELKQMSQQSTGSVNQLHDGLDSLLGKIAMLQRTVYEKDQLLEQLTEEKRELAKECVTHRAQVELYVKQLELFVKDTSTTSLSAARHAERTNDETASLSSAVEDYLAQIHSKEAIIQSLTEQLKTERRAHQEKAVEVRALGLQLDTFRGKLEALQAQQQQQASQRVMMDEVQSRLFGALDTIRATHNTSNLASKIEELSHRVRSTEQVEIQLRLKEDELVLLREELTYTSELKSQLQDSLEAISVMFTQLPQNLEDVERCVIERDAYKEEIDRAYATHSAPDRPHVLGLIELKLLELQSAGKQQSHLLKRKLRLQQKQNKNSGEGSSASDSADPEDTNGRTPDEGLDQLDEEAYELHKQLDALMDIPPLPELHAGLFHVPAASSPHLPADATLNDDVSILRQPTSLTSMLSPLKSPTPGPAALNSSAVVGGNGVSSADAVMTFQLFDDQSAGVLTASVLELCLATLGLRRRLPQGVTSMTAEEFVAFCCAA